LVNRPEFQPLRKLIVDISNTIWEDCVNLDDLNEEIKKKDRALFNTKLSEATDMLNTDITRIKARNDNLSDPEVKRKHNANLIKAMAKLNGGAMLHCRATRKRKRSKRNMKTLRLNSNAKN
jgi:hypothetical protein